MRNPSYQTIYRYVRPAIYNPRRVGRRVGIGCNCPWYGWGRFRRISYVELSLGMLKAYLLTFLWRKDDSVAKLLDTLQSNRVRLGIKVGVRTL